MITSISFARMSLVGCVVLLKMFPGIAIEIVIFINLEKENNRKVDDECFIKIPIVFIKNISSKWLVIGFCDEIKNTI